MTPLVFQYGSFRKNVKHFHLDKKLSTLKTHILGICMFIITAQSTKPFPMKIPMANEWHKFGTPLSNECHFILILQEPHIVHLCSLIIFIQ